VKAIAETLAVSRSTLYEPQQPRGPYRKVEDERLLPVIRAITDVRPTYGYRRVTAVLNRQRRARGDAPINHKRVYRLMQRQQLCLARATSRPGRTHTGVVVTPESNQRWCSDVFEIACWNGERVRVAFSLDTCDREVMSWVGTTGGISADQIQDLIAEAVAVRFGLVEQVPQPIEWLSDNGPAYTAHATCRFATSLGLRVCTTPVRSPESNGVAEAFVKTFKRDYVHVSRLDSAPVVLDQLPIWCEDYNTQHPHQGVKMRSPREYRQSFTAASLCPV